MRMINVKCPLCRKDFDLDTQKYTEIDMFNCPNCNMLLNYVKRKGKIIVTELGAE